MPIEIRPNPHEGSILTPHGFVKLEDIPVVKPENKFSQNSKFIFVILVIALIILIFIYTKPKELKIEKYTPDLKNPIDALPKAKEIWIRPLSDNVNPPIIKNIFIQSPIKEKIILKGVQKIGKEYLLELPFIIPIESLIIEQDGKNEPCILEIHDIKHRIIFTKVLEAVRFQNILL